ncbi:MAG: hypothetical protein ACREUH_02035, partial [Burkholderiales bacterium]
PPTLALPPVLQRMPLPPVVQPSPLPRGTLLLAAPVINTRTGDIMTLDSAIRLTVDPTISVKTLNTTLLTSPTLSTSTLSTTTLRDSTVLTTTKLSTTTTIAPTTEFKLLSPTLTTFR